MNFIDFFVFFENYSLPTIIISAVITLLTVLFDKFFSKNLSVSVKGYAPFVFGVILYFIYDSVFVSKRLNFSEDVVSAGIICGSLSCILFSLFKKIISGDFSPLNQAELSVYKTLSPYISGKKINKTVKKIIALLDEYFLSEEIKETEETLNLKIVSIIKENSDETLSEEDFITLARITVTSYKSLKNL